MSCSYSEKDISTTSLSTIAFLGCFTFIIKKIRNIEFQQKHFGINLRRTMVSYRIRIHEVYPENLRRLSEKNVTFSPDGTVSHDCSLERIYLRVYFSMKMFLDQFLEEKIGGEKSLNFVIPEIPCYNSLPFLLMKILFHRIICSFSKCTYFGE